MNPQQANIYRPYDEEAPWELLALCGYEDTSTPNLEFMRIAKFDSLTAGVYLLVKDTPLSFRVAALAVIPQARHQGLGRWLVGHAIGLAESKGGRELWVGARCAPGFFKTQHFQVHPRGLVLAFTPE